MIYEPEDFDKIYDDECTRLNRASDKLKRIRMKIKKEEELKSLDGTPTTIELEVWLNDKTRNKAGN